MEPLFLSAEQERNCLNYDPFAGDDDPDTKIFSDRIVTAAFDRPQGACCICFGSIAKGERHRCQKARHDGKFKNCRMCRACCGAMAIALVDDGNAIELRTELGMRRSGAFGRLPEPNLTELEFYTAKQMERVRGERSAELDDGARSRAAVERMADALDDIAAPPAPHLPKKWLVLALAVLAGMAILYRVIAVAHHGG